MKQHVRGSKFVCSSGKEQKREYLYREVSANDCSPCPKRVVNSTIRNLDDPLTEIKIMPLPRIYIPNIGSKEYIRNVGKYTINNYNDTVTNKGNLKRILRIELRYHRAIANGI